MGVLVLSRCSSPPSNDLKNGLWRAELQREDGQQVVFNFELADSAGQKVLYVFNAKERLRVDSIRQQGDSLYIQMPFFGSHFEAVKTGDSVLDGRWIKDYGTRKVSMPFHAVAGDSSRLTAYQPASANVAGSWEAVFPREDGNDFKAIGLFEQQGDAVTGTFLTPVGDYRYLQGVISGDTLKLSGFDGSHALLFTALIDSARLTDGKLYSINSAVAPWHAERKAYDSLPAAYAVDNIQPGTVKLGFSLKDMRTGEQISLQDEAYKGKVVVIQLLGSWCPNCMDETPYLTQYYKANKDRGIAFIGIDFERTADFEQSRQALNSFFSHFDITYPVVFSGVASSDPELTKKVFPELLPAKIHAFPTTIFIDKTGYVRKLHSGFNGPATGKYYTEFQEEFNSIINGLLAE